MTVVSGGDRTDEIRERLERIPDSDAVTLDKELVRSVLADFESLRARVEAAEAERDDAVREMEARELHHFEVENERDAALAVIADGRQMIEDYTEERGYRTDDMVDVSVHLGLAPMAALAARDARIRRAALEEAAEALNKPASGATYEMWSSDAGTWLRVRAAEEGEKQ